MRGISTASLDAGLTVAAHPLVAGSLGAVSGECVVLDAPLARRDLSQQNRRVLDEQDLARLHDGDVDADVDKLAALRRGRYVF